MIITYTHRYSQIRTTLERLYKFNFISLALVSAVYLIFLSPTNEVIFLRVDHGKTPVATDHEAYDGRYREIASNDASEQP